MTVFQHTKNTNQKNGILTDMNTGTGWPFGGPEITPELAASKMLVRKWVVSENVVFQAVIKPEENKQPDAVLQKLMAYQGKKVINITSKVDKNNRINFQFPAGKWTVIAVFNGKTYQKVKRAAPGGEGYVMDHFSVRATKKYFDKFDRAFSKNNTAYPDHFFNDSYEVYGADWTADFFEQFEKRRGYKLENCLPYFLSEERTELTARIIADYRETISDLLRDNFTANWTSWAHKNGSKTRNQAHGSPGNLIDLYASVDIPECEGFGLSDFNIPGLRKDSLTKKNDSDLSMLKYASSAAHISGKQFTSSETFTWLTEHFRTSLSQCKPDLDLMFVSGVNRMYFHGTPYSPVDAAWPGWLFYASINMSPTNTIWKDAPAMFQYITRCQSFLQEGKPDNDFLLYLPVYDVWQERSGRFFQFSIHDMEKIMPDFIHAVHAIYQQGYDVDYISDRFILDLKVVDKKLVTSAGVAYKSLILPAVKVIPLDVMKHISKLIRGGATIVFLDRMPQSVPGLKNYQNTESQLKKLINGLKVPAFTKNTTVIPTGKGRIISGTDYADALKLTGVSSEEMITKHGLHAIRRSNETGHHYFISALHDRTTDGWVKLAVSAKSVVIFDPVSGKKGKAKVRINQGATEVYLQMRPGNSLILKTFETFEVDIEDWIYITKISEILELNQGWDLNFDSPELKQKFSLDKPVYWTDLNRQELDEFAGTGTYSINFKMDKKAGSHYLLQLFDVRESARIKLNNREVAVLWSVPFECLLDDYLKDGENQLQIEVTNLPANKIAGMDRKGIKWRIFNEINMVNIKYKPSDYSSWSKMDSGLSGKVRIIQY